MNKKYLGIVAGLLLLAGCSNDDFTNNNNVQQKLSSFSTVQATIGDAVDTRAYVVNDNTSSNKSIAWRGNDNIFVLSDTQHYFSRFGMISLENNVGVFGGDQVSGKKFYGLYPEYNWTLDNSFPQIIHYEMTNDIASDENDFQFYAPMVAISDNNSFSFMQTTGMIHVSIGNIFYLEKAVLFGNCEEYLSGPGYIDLTEASPIFRIDENPTWYDTGKWGWVSQETNGSAKDIYFMIPPTIFEKGFRIEIYGKDQNGNNINVTKSTSKKVVVDRAQVRNFELVDVGAELIAQQELVKENEAKIKPILKKFYDALGGDNWYNNTNWNSDAPLSEWFGLQTDESGFLTTIYMWPDNNLRGDIPYEIGELTTLEIFEILGSNFTIPESFGNLTNLRTFWVSGAIMESFPEWIYNLKNLSALGLQSCQLDGNLPENLLNELPNLYELALSNNNFEGEIPATYFGNNTNLRGLYLYDNRLSGIITRNMQNSPMWQNLEHIDIVNQQDGYGITIEGAVQSISVMDITGSNNITLKVGDTVQLTAIVEPQDADNTDVTWRINYWRDADWNEYWYGNETDNQVISLENGLVTALKPGYAGIRVMADDNYGANGWCYINIVE